MPASAPTTHERPSQQPPPLHISPAARQRGGPQTFARQAPPQHSESSPQCAPSARHPKVHVPRLHCHCVQQSSSLEQDSPRFSHWQLPEVHTCEQQSELLAHTPTLSMQPAAPNGPPEPGCPPPGAPLPQPRKSTKTTATARPEPRAGEVFGLPNGNGPPRARARERRCPSFRQSRNRDRLARGPRRGCLPSSGRRSDRGTARPASPCGCRGAASCW